MPNITIQGNKFDVPEALVARFAVGYTINDEGEANALKQVFLENLRNNFAGKVKAVAREDGEVPAEALPGLQEEFGKYAEAYKFGTRTGGGGGRRVVDPIEREMIKIARDDIGRAYFAKYGEKVGKDQKEWLDEKIEELLGAKHDDYAKRARAVIKARESQSQDLGLDI